MHCRFAHRSLPSASPALLLTRRSCWANFALPLSQATLEKVERLHAEISEELAEGSLPRKFHARASASLTALQLLRSLLLRHDVHVVLAHLSRVGEREIQRRRRAGVAGCGMLPVSLTMHSTVRLVTELARSLKAASSSGVGNSSWPRKARLAATAPPRPGMFTFSTFSGAKSGAGTGAGARPSPSSSIQQPKRMCFSSDGIQDVLKVEETIIDTKFVHDSMVEQRISPSRRRQGSPAPREPVPRSG